MSVNYSRLSPCNRHLSVSEGRGTSAEHHWHCLREHLRVFLRNPDSQRGSQHSWAAAAAGSSPAAGQSAEGGRCLQHMKQAEPTEQQQPPLTVLRSWLTFRGHQHSKSPCELDLAFQFCVYFYFCLTSYFLISLRGKHQKCLVLMWWGRFEWSIWATLTEQPAFISSESSFNICFLLLSATALYHQKS